MLAELLSPLSEPTSLSAPLLSEPLLSEPLLSALSAATHLVASACRPAE